MNSADSLNFYKTHKLMTPTAHSNFIFYLNSWLLQCYEAHKSSWNRTNHNDYLLCLIPIKRVNMQVLVVHSHKALHSGYFNLLHDISYKWHKENIKS